MQMGKVWSSVEFVVGLALLAGGLGAHFVGHVSDPRVLSLAPFGGGLIMSDAVSRLAKRAAGRLAGRRGSAR